MIQNSYRKVIDLFKEKIANNNVDPDRIMDVRKELASQITAARITGDQSSELYELMNDLNFISELK